MPHDLTETTVMRVADLVVDQIKRQHVCVHEADIAVLFQATEQSKVAGEHAEKAVAEIATRAEKVAAEVAARAEKAAAEVVARAEKTAENFNAQHGVLQEALVAREVAAARSEEIVEQLGKGLAALQQIVTQNTIDIATNRAQKRAALVIISMLGGLVGSLGGIVAMLTFMRNVMLRP